MATDMQKEIDRMTWVRIRGAKWCPLIVIPPHGDLKDFGDILRIFDKVIHDVDDDTNALLCDLIAQIQAAPTIVEATCEGKGIPATS